MSVATQASCKPNNVTSEMPGLENTVVTENGQTSPEPLSVDAAEVQETITNGVNGSETSEDMNHSNDSDQSSPALQSGAAPPVSDGDDLDDSANSEGTLPTVLNDSATVFTPNPIHVQSPANIPLFSSGVPFYGMSQMSPANHVVQATATATTTTEFQPPLTTSPHSPNAQSPRGTSPPSSSSTPGSTGSHTQQHVVHVHINPGESFCVRVGDQVQHIQGPATVRMVSNNGPPLPMPMQVQPGHMVHQIVDENGILTHVILSPQPHGMMGNPMTGGPNTTGQFYPPYTGQCHYSSQPQFPSPHHHNHHGVTQHIHPPAGGGGGATRAHGTPPPTTCNNHGGSVAPAPSSPLNSMDDRTNRQKNRVRKKYQQRLEEGHYNRVPPRRLKARGMNGDVPHPPMSPQENGSEIEEERRVIQQQLSSMPEPKVTDIESRRAVIVLSPPEYDQKTFDIDPGEFFYELFLCERGGDSKYKLVYSGDATVITLKDLKPAIEYHLKVSANLDDVKGTETEPISFKTCSCEPDRPQCPKLQHRTKTAISLKWSSVCENGSKITAYVLEYDQGEGSNVFVEVYNGLQRQYRVPKLAASTKYTFRLCVVNGVGRSDYSEHVTLCTCGSPPSQPDPPMMSEVFVNSFIISWIKRPNDDEFQLQLEDESSGHGFMPVYNGQNLSSKVNQLRRNKEYKFRLAAKNEEGSSKWSEVIAYRTLPGRPEQPAKPQIKGKVHAHSFRITWDPPRDDGGSEITKYIVELDDGKDYQTMYEGSEREHTCDRLTPGHTYHVRVAACSKGGRSEWSENCIASTQCVNSGPCQAPKLQGKPKATSLHLKWGYPEYNGGAKVQEFAVQMILPDNTSREVYKGMDLDCIVAGLSPGRPYLFQVRAFNRAGAGPWSEPLEVVSGAGVPDPPKMAHVTCRTSHSAIINWEEPVNNGATVTEYRLECQHKSDSDFTQIYYGSNTSYEMKGLNPATLYTFRVQAINSAGAGQYSPVSTCVTPPSSPSPVLSIRTSPTATSVLVQWKEPHNNGSEIVAYNLDIEKQHINVSAVNEYTIETLSPETTYKLRIQAVNGIGEGSFSAPVKFTTRALPPNPPKLECVGVAPTSLKMKWGEGRNIDLISFVLEMDKDEGHFQELYKGQGYTFKVNRLTEMTTYEFRMYACNDAGSGPYSEIFSFTTTKAPPPPLKAPRVFDIEQTRCSVDWQGCRPMGSDKIIYQLQLQSRDQEFKQVYSGPDMTYCLQNLHPKIDYTIRVCAVRQSSTNDSNLVGAFSPGHLFSMKCPEPVKPVDGRVTDLQLSEPKQMSDQKLAAMFVAVLMFVAILIAFVVQQFISYASSPATGRS